MSEQGKMTDAEIVESYTSDLYRKTVMSKDMERLTEAMEEYAIATNDFDVIAAESIAEGVLESTWLREHDAKVQAEALREFAHSIPGDVHDARDVADLARVVADHIEKEAGL